MCGFECMCVSSKFIYFLLNKFRRIFTEIWTKSRIQEEENEQENDKVYEEDQGNEHRGGDKDWWLLQENTALKSLGNTIIRHTNCEPLLSPLQIFNTNINSMFLIVFCL